MELLYYGTTPPQAHSLSDEVDQVLENGFNASFIRHSGYFGTVKVDQAKLGGVE